MRRHLALVLWLVAFFVPAAAMVTLDGFCRGQELCHAGLTFTLLLYAGGVIAFIISIVLARLAFRALRTLPRTRIIVLKWLFVVPLLPGLAVAGLLLRSLFR
jgi:hypothetical protein